MQKRIKSYGNRYILAHVKTRINRFKILKILLICLFVIEIILGILWALGY